MATPETNLSKLINDKTAIWDAYLAERKRIIELNPNYLSIRPGMDFDLLECIMEKWFLDNDYNHYFDIDNMNYGDYTITKKTDKWIWYFHQGKEKRAKLCKDELGEEWFYCNGRKQQRRPIEICQNIIRIWNINGIA
jgi:hypothetical protein